MYIMYMYTICFCISFGFIQSTFHFYTHSRDIGSTIVKPHKCSIIVTASKMDWEINFSEIELCISSRIVTALFGVQVV